MGRKNLFGGFEPPQIPPSSEKAQRPVSSPTGSVSPLALLKNDRKNLVRDINTDVIRDRRYSDRLSIEGPDLDALIESMRELGQTVPALVRPLPGEQSGFEIIYGRRRLEAARRLGWPLRAAIQELDDRDALRVQGSENNRRIDPSFIEKAAFAHQLVEDEWSRDVVAETLSVNNSYISKMLKIVSIVSLETISDLGGCPGISRRRWEDLIEDLALLDMRSIARPGVDFSHDSSDARFEAFRDAVAQLADSLKSATHSAETVEPSAEPPAPETAEDTTPKRRELHRAKVPFSFGRTGAARVSLDQTARSVNLRFPRVPDTEGFDTWLRKNVETVLKDIQDRWIRENSSSDPETPNEKGDADPMP